MLPEKKQLTAPQFTFKSLFFISTTHVPRFKGPLVLFRYGLEVAAFRVFVSGCCAGLLLWSEPLWILWLVPLWKSYTSLCPVSEWSSGSELILESVSPHHRNRCWRLFRPTALSVVDLIGHLDGERCSSTGRLHSMCRSLLTPSVTSVTPWDNGSARWGRWLGPGCHRDITSDISVSATRSGVDMEPPPPRSETSNKICYITY